jgi:hypothetical protein
MTTQLKSESTTWHVQNWGAWGWAETILKLIGIAVAIFGLVNILPAFSLGFPLTSKLLALIVLGLMSLMSLFIVTLRFGQREITSFAFAILSAIGHISALLVLLQSPAQTFYPTLVFAAAYLLGELVKIQFLRVTGYTESGRDQSAMQKVPVVFATAYLLILIFTWF